MDNQRVAARLHGAWVIDPADEVGLREYGPVTLEFAPDGHLTFTAHGDGHDEIALLDYRVDGDLLVMRSGVSVAPESRARFCLTPGGALELRHGDQLARYIRRADERDQRDHTVAPVALPAPGALVEESGVIPHSRPERPWWRFW